MSKNIESAKLRNFIIVWIGQFVSSLGSSMTSFATTIWAWEVTGEATSLTLVGFFYLLPTIFIAPISGVIVDRFNRKWLMIIGDAVSIGMTFVIFLLYLTNNLQIWHLYLQSAIVGSFNQLQRLAYSASVVLMIPKKHYSRASSMEFISGYGSEILAPSLAGFLYRIIGFAGISLIDIITFAVAISTVIWVHIPQPSFTETEQQNRPPILQELGFGWRYIQARKGLLALLFVSLLFWLPHDLGDALYSPMILARSGNNTLALGSLASAAGLGGVTGAIIITTWGGFKPRIKGVLLGMVGAGISKIFFGLSRTPLVWIPAQFCSSFNFPINGSSETAIWLAKVPPNLQGRVFATRSLFLQLVSAFAYLIAGPLADRIFEPAMKSENLSTSILARIFGTGTGAGMSIIYVLCALCMLIVGVCGYQFRILHNLEQSMPDGDS
ncbi:MFS transporter [Nostoc sp. HG1]|nr:MFS transporter [Nostoc sp. HG1]